jgi:hypothetical protein
MRGHTRRMPAGRYTVMDGEGNAVGTEEFRCAPGPAGWRYFSEVETIDPNPHREIVDLAVDAAWRPVRTRIDTGAHTILLQAEGSDRLAGYRDGAPVETPWGSDVHLDYLSPAYNAVTARRLTAGAEIEVVYLEAFTCEPRIEHQRYELVNDEVIETPVGRFSARRWRYTALASGWSRDLWVAGDVVVAYEGLFELEWYDAGASGEPAR